VFYLSVPMLLKSVPRFVRRKHNGEGAQQRSCAVVCYIWTPQWRFGVAVTRWSCDQCSCSTSSPVSTGMGDCLRVGI